MSTACFDSPIWTFGHLSGPSHLYGTLVLSTVYTFYDISDNLDILGYFKWHKCNFIEQTYYTKLLLIKIYICYILIFNYSSASTTCAESSQTHINLLLWE